MRVPFSVLHWPAVDGNNLDSQESGYPLMDEVSSQCLKLVIEMLVKVYGLRLVELSPGQGMVWHRWL